MAENNDVVFNALSLLSPVSQPFVARGVYSSSNNATRKKDMAKCLRRTVLNVATGTGFTL